ncbi:hypothetical protein D7004_19475 [Pedobacter jejuensis]|uniref:Uncharacterized protein n=1 Tax=Pedobacter jejuensis TaxID=1268550 RepID=A0A3N0BLH0_9SPHI|nr:hypothetical protein D7004_19475 [Pedobacter jejuensis]
MVSISIFSSLTKTNVLKKPRLNFQKLSCYQYKSFIALANHQYQANGKIKPLEKIFSFWVLKGINLLSKFR